MDEVVFEFEQETDGRWIGEYLRIPGCLAYGATQQEAARKLIVLVLQVVADRLEHGEEVPPEFASLVPA